MRRQTTTNGVRTESFGFGGRFLPHPSAGTVARVGILLAIDGTFSFGPLLRLRQFLARGEWRQGSWQRGRARATAEGEQEHHAQSEAVRRTRVAHQAIIPRVCRANCETMNMTS